MTLTASALAQGAPPPMDDEPTVVPVEPPKAKDADSPGVKSVKPHAGHATNPKVKPKAKLAHKPKAKAKAKPKPKAAVAQKVKPKPKKPVAPKAKPKPHKTAAMKHAPKPKKPGPQGKPVVPAQGT
jgi:hypothetical protein